MKPRNFPGRKLLRRMNAFIRTGYLDFLDADELIAERKVRTKKNRAERSPLPVPKKLKRGQRRGPTS